MNRQGNDSRDHRSDGAGSHMPTLLRIASALLRLAAMSVQRTKPEFQTAVPRFILGWSGGAKVLGNLPVPGRPTDLDYSRARACCACNRCGWGVVWTFLSHLSFLFVSLSLGDGPI